MENYRIITEPQLLTQCRFEAFRGPGPGGQKRNKTSSAVRLTHQPTRISVIAGESRSQHQNRAAAIRRLQHRIAVEIRMPFDPISPGTPLNLNVSRRSKEYLPLVGRVLDAMNDAGWSVSSAAALLGLSTGQLVAFLQADDKGWAEVNQNRKKKGLRTLN